MTSYEGDFSHVSMLGIWLLSLLCSIVGSVV